MNSKTIKEWLEGLPEPYRTQALKNTKDVMLGSQSTSSYYALKRAFRWADSPEGFDHWDFCSRMHT